MIPDETRAAAPGLRPEAEITAGTALGTAQASRAWGNALVAAPIPLKAELRLPRCYE